MRTYQPPITPEHHTCVGLGLTLLDRLRALDHRFPGLASRVYLVSCEETVDDIVSYVHDDPHPPSVEKEHVMVALKLNIAGRRGLLLLDPGYHIARVVTVMEDELYPHTGWFMQAQEEHCRKDYNYSFTANCNYVVWRVKERRGDGPEMLSHSAVFVARPFLAPVDVTERRNLVYNFRSLLSRDTKGHLTAGVYFPVLDNTSGKFTLFYEVNDVKKRDKMSFSDFKALPNMLDEKQQLMIEECNKLLGFQPGELYVMLHSLANLLSDSSYISQLLLMNRNINDMAENN
uniref:Uncharacterized protein n=1 Tax=Graphocephala atropunctata TaxID=36148 RepID=A0A1B6KF53_9HEMI